MSLRAAITRSKKVPIQGRGPTAVASYPVMVGWASFRIEEWQEFVNSFAAVHKALTGNTPGTPYATHVALMEAREAWARTAAKFRALVGDGYLGK